MKNEQIVNDIFLFQEFLRYQSGNANTPINYGSSVKSFLFSFSKEYSRPADIPTDVIVAYILRFENLSTRRNVHSAIKRYYKWKSKNGISTKFRCVPYPIKPDTIPDHVTMDDFINIMRICDNLKHRCIILLAFDCGLRVSEVINLKIKDIDSKQMNIIVRESKGKKDRILKLTEITLKYLREYFLEYKPTDYLFNGQTTLQYSVRSCQEVLKQLCEKAKIKHYKFHSLRHGMAMMLYETGGYSLETIRDLLGHSSVESTKIYARKNNNIIQRTLSPVEILMANKHRYINKIQPPLASINL